ncbi:increased DNA methylation 1-like [Trifolium pratense]|uniref:increased DNA methylation 1-like n=1 Tax=Trifolium pratense TaxID=57577 RepID=UPI001E697028|nr:increased DNA methylation 1-like [Trifolium pratense]
MRYTNTDGKTFASLKLACQSCIESGGCSLKQPSTAPTTKSISSSQLQSKKRPRESQVTGEEDEVFSCKKPYLAAAPPATSVLSFPLQSMSQPTEYKEAMEEEDSFSFKHLSFEAPPADFDSDSTSDEDSDRDSTSDEDSDSDSTSDEDSDSDSTSDEDSDDSSTSDEDFEPSNPSFGKKAPVTMVSTSKENENQASQSESEVTNSAGSCERGKVLKLSVMEKNSESCNNRGKVLKTGMVAKNSEGCRKRGMVLKREGVRERYSLVSWLVKNQILVPGTDVFCRGSNNVVKRGSLFSEGIVCDCCHVNFTVTGFEAHAGCTRHRPTASILLEDGRSLLECQREAQSLRDQTGNHCVAEANSEANNDNVCGICGFGGDIVLCDRCPSSFHLSCLGLDRVPDGDWFCPTCCCKICYGPKCKEECADQTDNNILACVQCEQKFHSGCVKAIGGFGPTETESNANKKTWFCSVVCGNMFLCLKKLLGKSITIADNITWTLLKNDASSDYDYDGGKFTSNDFSLNKRKLNAALGVLYESFNPSIDAFSGRELIKDVVFSRDSKHNRLNFRGFYNVILEKKGAVASVATIRIYGPKVAEIVFVATKEQYRKQGLCRLLMDELEKQLIRLGVGSFVLHSSEHAINTWTKSFGFNRMSGKEKCQFIDNTFLEFQNSIMCLKRLNRPIWPYIAGC